MVSHPLIYSYPFSEVDLAVGLFSRSSGNEGVGAFPVYPDPSPIHRLDQRGRSDPSLIDRSVQARVFFRSLLGCGDRSPAPSCDQDDDADDDRDTEPHRRHVTRNVDETRPQHRDQSRRQDREDGNRRDTDPVTLHPGALLSCLTSRFRRLVGGFGLGFVHAISLGEYEIDG